MSAYSVETSISCGVDQFVGVSLTDPKEALKEFIKEFRSWPPAFVIFSDNSEGNGSSLATLLAKNHFTVQATEEQINNNSNNQIRIWIVSDIKKGIEYVDKNRKSKTKTSRPLLGKGRSASRRAA